MKTRKTGADHILYALEWVLNAAENYPRALGFRFNKSKSTLTIKLLENCRLIEEIEVVKELVDLKKFLSMIKDTRPQP